MAGAGGSLDDEIPVSFEVHNNRLNQKAFWCPCLVRASSSYLCCVVERHKIHFNPVNPVISQCLTRHPGASRGAKITDGKVCASLEVTHRVCKEALVNSTLFWNFWLTKMEDVIDIDADPKQSGSEAAEAHYVRQYFIFTNRIEAKQGRSRDCADRNCGPMLRRCYRRHGMRCT